MSHRDPWTSCRRRLGWMIPVALVAVVVAFAAVSVGVFDDAPAPPLAIRAAGPRFETIEALADASDLIVEATVVAVDDGRSITDPSNPEAGVRTSLARLRVEEVFAGADLDTVVVEQEASLLDGTPIIVNGLTPNEVGQSGYWFLVEGASDEFPYVALINEQARVLRSGEDLVGSDLVAGVSDTQFRARLAI